MSRTLTPLLLPGSPPSLFLPAVHKCKGLSLVGSSPDFGDSVTRDVPSILPDEPITAASFPQ